MSRFEETSYDRPKSPNIDLDERLFVASFLQNKDIFLNVREMNIKDWFFADELSKNIFFEAMRVIERKSFELYKSAIIGGEDVEFKNAFSKFLTKEDPSFYINDFYEMGDVAFYGLIDGHMRARQAKECKRLGGAIQDKIYLGVSIREEVSRLNEMLPSSTRREFYSCNEILEEIKQGGGEIACRTGIGCIDRMVKILEGGFVVVIGGESSTGKTTITNQIAYRINADDVGHGMYFSTETDRARLGMRFVKYIKSLHGCTQDEANERFGEMKNLSISSAHYTPEMLIKEIRDAYNSEKGCKFVYVDYFQNLQFNGRNSKLEQLEDAIKGIHALAQELHIVIFVLSQLVKENYGPTVKTKPIPSLSTFRGCAQIGNSADVAMILQRPAMGPPDKSRPIPTDLFVVKQKEGEQCKIPLELLGSENTFVERESE